MPKNEWTTWTRWYEEEDPSAASDEVVEDTSQVVNGMGKDVEVAAGRVPGGGGDRFDVTVDVG